VLITLLIFLLISNAVCSKRDKSILYSRVVITTLIITSFLPMTDLFVLSLGKAIGLYGGLFHVQAFTHSFHIFILLISAVIIVLTTFYPRKVLIKEQQSLYKLIFSKFIYNATTISNKMAEQFRIIEYPLIIVFIISSAVWFCFLLNTTHIVVMCNILLFIYYFIYIIHLLKLFYIDESFNSPVFFFLIYLILCTFYWIFIDKDLTVLYLVSLLSIITTFMLALKNTRNLTFNSNNNVFYKLKSMFIYLFNNKKLCVIYIFTFWLTVGFVKYNILEYLFSINIEINLFIYVYITISLYLPIKILSGTISKIFMNGSLNFLFYTRSRKNFFSDICKNISFSSIFIYLFKVILYKIILLTYPDFLFNTALKAWSSINNPFEDCKRRFIDLMLSKSNKLDLMRSHILPPGNYSYDINKVLELERKMALSTEKQMKITKNLFTNLEKDAIKRGVNMGNYPWLEKNRTLYLLRFILQIYQT